MRRLGLADGLLGLGDLLRAVAALELFEFRRGLARRSLGGGDRLPERLGIEFGEQLAGRHRIALLDHGREQPAGLAKREFDLANVDISIE